MIEFVYDLIYILPLCMVSILSYFALFGIEEAVPTGCVAGVFFVLFVIILLHVRLKERVLVCGVVAVATLGFIWVLGDEKRRELFSEYFFMTYIMGLAFLCIILGKLTQKYLSAKLISAFIIIGNCVYFMVNGMNVSAVLIACSMLLLLVYFVTEIQRHWEKSGYTELKTHVSLTTPVLMLVFLLVLAIPAPKDAFDWTFAKNIWKSIVVDCKRVAGLFSEEYEGISYSGFSTDGAMSGAIEAGDREVMLVTPDGKSADYLYLGGITLNDFSKGGWKSNIEEPVGYRKFDFLETRAAIIKYGKGFENEYIREDKIDIENRLINTKHLFLPTKVNLLSKRSTVPVYTEKEEAVVTDSKLRYGDLYSTAYYSLNLANEELFNLIDGGELLTAEDWKTVLKWTSLTDDESVSYNSYQIYRDSIYEKYGKTYGLSDELNSLVMAVTDGIEGDYEKLNALAIYLQRMDYNTHPGDIPDTVTNPSEFLDYFMLESKNGYCVHYATAFVLLARECGYPARYVQGFYVPVKNGAKEYIVTDQNAHSWAEVYFDNFGWVNFEATPGYKVSSGWSVGSYVDASTLINQPSYNEDTGNTDPISVEEIIIEEEKSSFNIKYVLIPFALVLLFCVMFFCVNKCVMIHRYKKMDRNEKAKFMVKLSLRIFQFLGFEFMPYETVSEYGQRITNKLNDVEIMPFFLIYEKMCYADFNISDEDENQLERIYGLLKSRLKGHGIKYFLLL